MLGAVFSAPSSTPYFPRDTHSPKLSATLSHLLPAAAGNSKVVS
jgi:hypothetical protein